MNKQRQISESRIRKTGKHIGKIYVVGILAFTGIIGFITLFALFMANLKI